MIEHYIEPLTGYEDFLLISGSSNLPLCQKVAKRLKIALAEVNLTSFPDSDRRVSINSLVRGKHVYIMQAMVRKTAEYFMETALLADAARRASAREITGVFPYFPYGREDKKTRSGQPISARLAVNLLESSGIQRFLAIDLHCSQIQGFTDRPFDHLHGQVIYMPYLLQKYGQENLVIVAMDAGGAPNVLQVANIYHLPFAMINKFRHPESGAVKILDFVGDVRDKIAVPLDDIFDTCGTLKMTVQELKRRGAKQVVACGTHGVFSGKAIKEIKDLQDLGELVCLDTVSRHNKGGGCTKLHYLSAADLLAAAISRIHRNKKLGILFPKKPSHS